MHIRYFKGYLQPICLQDTISLHSLLCPPCQALLLPRTLLPLLRTTWSGFGCHVFLCCLFTFFLNHKRVGPPQGVICIKRRPTYMGQVNCPDPFALLHHALLLGTHWFSMLGERSRGANCCLGNFGENEAVLLFTRTLYFK